MHAALWGSLAVVGLAVIACRALSEQVADPHAGMNGGFEQARSGLPVNWIVYTPSLRSRNCELQLDQEDFTEGTQSLHFLVGECSSAGGRRSPGITQEYRIGPGTTYSLRFWIKSEECAWTVSIGGVAAKTGEYERLTSSEFPAAGWQEIEREYTVPPEFERLRFELSITSPGELWVDDVRIEPLVRPAQE